MKNTELLKKVTCVCTALVLMHVALLDVTAAVQPDNLANAARQIQNNKLYTDSTPCIVSTTYPAEDVVVADIIATQAPYFADTTGVVDSTIAIQRALDDCHAAGGGTVFLPAGKYLMTAGVTVPGFVTLRGDWQDPDTGTDYGTIILADVPSTTDNLPALFTVLGSAGVMGLTVYYPGQRIDDVKPYPYTFYVSGAGGFMLQSIVNCTVINGYKGIGACVDGGGHEMMTIDTVKGAFLYCGATAYNQSDVGTWKNLTVSNRYWAESGAGFTAPPREAIDAYTRKNTIGLVLGDLEWTQFANIEIADCKYGMHIVKGKRIEFAGSLFDVKIERCDVGIQVDSIDTRWGMVIAKSQINGSKNAIVNNTFGVVKMSGTTLSGGRVGGRIIFKDIGEFFKFIQSIFKNGFLANCKYLFECGALDAFEVDYDAALHKPAEQLFVVEADKNGAQDATPSIQATLNQAAETGGVVYLPAGKYRMNAPVTVPAGVELRGATSVATRDQQGSSKGTVILAYYGLNPVNSDSDTALVTLGANAGVRGIRFFYPENSCVRPGLFGTVQPCTYAVRGTGSGVYAVNVAIAAAYNGIDFRGCDNHHIKKVVTCCYSNAIHAGGTGGIIEGCLQNGTVMARNGLNLPNRLDEGTQMFPYLFDAVTRMNTEYIRLTESQNQTLYNCFAYGVKSFLVNANSADLLAFNIGADNIGGTMLVTQGGNAAVINMMRWNGTSYRNDGTALKMVNRLTIEDKTERTVK
ncbi:MAG: hypothetical protein GXZ02_00890 [Clostridiales bacterium]|nr:hypothetical protein [Clostridiales bacterium]